MKLKNLDSRLRGNDGAWLFWNDGARFRGTEKAWIRGPIKD